MKLFANLVSLLSIKTAEAGVMYTIWIWTDEPECPKELL